MIITTLAVVFYIDKRELAKILNLLYFLEFSRTELQFFWLKITAMFFPDFLGCIRILISRGGRVDARGNAGHTPLHLCTGKYSTRFELGGQSHL